MEALFFLFFLIFSRSDIDTALCDFGEATALLKSLDTSRDCCKSLVGEVWLLNATHVAT